MDVRLGVQAGRGVVLHLGNGHDSGLHAPVRVHVALLSGHMLNRSS